jgi:hypothetical protein
MLLAVAAMPSSSVAAAAGSPEVVELTLLANAREKGAVCLDGSPPGYHLQRGFGSGEHSWIVNLEGGAWCNTTEDCSDRKMTDLGSSKFMKAIEFEGILSNKRSQNPCTLIKMPLSWIPLSLCLFQRAPIRLDQLFDASHACSMGFVLIQWVHDQISTTGIKLT